MPHLTTLVRVCLKFISSESVLSALMSFYCSNVAGYSAEERRTCWPMVSPTVRATDGANYQGHYRVGSYSKDIISPANTAFLEWLSIWRPEQVAISGLNHHQEAFIATNLWAQAAMTAGSLDVAALQTAFIGQSFAAPEGEVTMMANHHTTKHTRVLRANADGSWERAYETVMAIPQGAWSAFLPETRGFVCDWTLTDGEALAKDTSGLQNVSAAFFKPPTLEMSVQLSFSGPSAAEARAATTGHDLIPYSTVCVLFAFVWLCCDLLHSPCIHALCFYCT